jgi:hypothetical protein
MKILLGAVHTPKASFWLTDRLTWQVENKSLEQWANLRFPPIMDPAAGDPASAMLERMANAVGGKVERHVAPEPLPRGAVA